MRLISKLIFIFLFLLSGFKSTAQIGERDFLYLNFEIRFGNYLGLAGGLNYILNEKYSFHVGMMGGIRNAKNKPGDYAGGLASAFVLGMDSPKDVIEDYSLMVGKIINLNSTQRVIFNIKGGVCYTRYYEPHKFEKLTSNWLTANYSYEVTEFRRMSFILNPVVEFPFTFWRGFNISPVLHVSKDRITYLIGIGGIIGSLRRRNE